jgi:hypothetical protein
VEFTYTEQMLLIKRNAGLLAELQKINKGKLIVLDSDDYLNPILSRKAHRLGIDMDFMVEYVGGDHISETTSENYEEEEY